VYNDALAYNGLGGLADLPLGGLAGAAGVTTFLKNGVPDVAKRTVATEKALARLQKALMGSGDPEMAAKIVAHAERYPRVMAHNTDISKGKLPSDVGGRNVPAMNIFSPQIGRSEIELNNTLPTAPRGESFFHELGHPAQRIGLKSDMTDVYNDYDDAMGYWDNPFETSARNIGTRAMQRINNQPVAKPQPINQTFATPLMQAIKMLTNR
jgi:hypothetical protein